MISDKTLCEIVDHLHQHFPELGDLKLSQTIALAEEVGEFVGASRRFLGMARRKGSIEDVRKELADVIITALVTAYVFGIDIQYTVDCKLEEIFNRGWRM
jgi:NTP pyrophosphatase (non-canonical NTP hydrolase)